jgi:uncharacterized protein (DUF2252 family)
MSFLAATRDYEKWLRTHVDVVEADLAEKHSKMAKSSFSFLRATFYRWVPVWLEACSDLAEAPRVLAVGDIHVENFGTWRDSEGRLAWGVNDFDEAAVMPYTLDLVRLAASALLAREQQNFRMSDDAICKAVLDGYRLQLRSGPMPFVLEEDHGPLRAAALSTERDPIKYWTKLQKLRTVPAPRAMRAMLMKELPAETGAVRIVHRTSGAGSLGRPRFVALGKLADANVAREAKAMIPSAFGWATGTVSKTLRCAELDHRAFRSHDPHMSLNGRWLIRRLGPRCSRIDLNMLPKDYNERYFLEAMGREIGNVHLGSDGAVNAIRAHLKRQRPGWLARAARNMGSLVLADWEAWRAR